MKLFLGSLPHVITENEIAELCTQFGEVLEVKLITDTYTGQSRGFAFVETPDRSQGHKVMENLNGFEYKHRKLVCNEAKPPVKRGSRRR